MKVFIVTGSVCTGKTTLARLIAKKYHAIHINVNDLIKEHKLYYSYNKKLKAYNVNNKKLNKFLISLIKNSRNNLVLDSHLSHYLPSKYVDLCYVTKCDLKVLKKRLEKRKYSKEKIRENLDAEILDVCLMEALKNKHKVKIIDTTKGIKP
ncbi:MAG: adenylate kinase family protein [Nanoarchaeota archaeon]